MICARMHMKIHTATPKILQPVRDEVLKLKAREHMEIRVEAKCKPGPLQYSWFYAHQPLPGKNSPQLTIHDISAAHQGTSVLKHNVVSYTPSPSLRPILLQSHQPLHQ